MNWIRAKTASGALLGGTWLNLGSSVTAEIAARAGYDWALIDLEHGSGDYKDLLHQLQAMAAWPIGTIVRVPEVSAAGFKQILDLGPSGLMIPNVATAEGAREIVALVRIPPRGTRGAAQSTRASGYGFGYERYVAEANDNLLVVAQIESREGLDNADAIAAIDGIDVLFVGPTDLSIDLGVAPDAGQGQFREEVSQVAQAARRHGKAAGVLVRDAAQAGVYEALGFSFIALGSDRGQVIAGMKQSAAAFDQLRKTSSRGTEPGR